MTLPPKPTKADRQAAEAALAAAEEEVARSKAAYNAAYATRLTATRGVEDLDRIDKLHKLPADVVALLSGGMPATAEGRATLKRRGLLSDGGGHTSRHWTWTYTAENYRRLLGAE